MIQYDHQMIQYDHQMIQYDHQINESLLEVVCMTFLLSYGKCKFFKYWGQKCLEHDQAKVTLPDFSNYHTNTAQSLILVTITHMMHTPSF